MRLQPTRRRGIILLVVLVMLTLFAIAGLTFVLYAEAASESARLNRGAEALSAPDMDPNVSFNYFLGQLIYGVSDTDGAGPYSALRGHSLAETMYGSYDSIAPVPSDMPYNGPGALHYTNANLGVDDYNLVNYTYFPVDGFVRDPGHYGTRANINPATLRGPVVSQNAPYTYWDRNSMFLAEVQQSGAAPGTVLSPSYFRANNPFGPLAPGNPNWTNPAAQFKYMTLRLRPADMGPGFPPPADAGGDVKNLVGQPGYNGGNNDSIWIDVGAPVLTTPSGLKYKMLVAPLVLDLDNRINLNVVGNVLGSYGSSGSIHASNQGWGAWEINMGKVLNPVASATYPTAPTDWKYLFVPSPNGLTGRYGPSGQPLSVFGFSGVAPHIYAPADFNGINDPIQGSTSLTQAIALPGQPGAQFFPLFPPQGYGNGAPMETTSNGQNNGTPLHPAFFSPFFPASGNRVLSLSSHASLMWAGAAASPNSDLVQLAPSSFNNLNDPSGTIRRINETTLLSMDLDRPGAAPYIWDPTNPAYNIVFNPAAGQPNGGYTSDGVPAPPAPFPAYAAPPANSDFSANTWRYAPPTVLLTLLPPGVQPSPPWNQRIDLNRQLVTYQASGGVQPPDREQFAWDIFTRFLTVTGMTGVYNSGAATPQQYATLRWLAQLSANIVDYIDTDDVMTVFQWTTAPQAPDTGYVFGTELPKLVVNEVYLEYDNDSNDPNPNPKNPTQKIATNPYHVNVWTELVNPLPSTTDPNAPPNGIQVNNDAKLTDPTGTIPLYQIVLTKQNQGIRNAANLAGDPDGAGGVNPPFATQPYTPSGDYDAVPAQQVLATFNQWATAPNNVQAVTPVGTTPNIPPPPPPPALSSQGFLIVGPPNPPLFKNQNANTQVQIPSSVTAPGTAPNNSMSYKVESTGANADPNANPPAGTTINNSLAPTVLLQRLANPNLPYQPVSTMAKYNPYVTVDYADMTAVGNALTKPVINDARGYDVNGPIGAGQPDLPNNRVSFGRKQPYAGNEGIGGVSQWLQQTAPGALGPNAPNTTFFSVNTPTNPATVPDWLVHLDRPLVSPMELLNVSGFKPHELTQQFIDVNGKKGDGLGDGHVAPWQDQNMRLYRLLEFLRVKNITPGAAPLGRVPGKININTLDPNATQVFEALCDSEPGNSFFNIAPGGDLYVDQLFGALIAARNQNGPFIGMAQGAYPAGGTDPQFLSPPFGNPNGAGLANTLLGAGLQTSAANRYQQMELLNKIYNNVTTRSNVFAVWLTVGFFQVTNDTTLPVQLGPEVNAAQGRAIRHHMFAIVDRTQIQTFSTTTAAAIGPGNGLSITPATPNPVSDPRTGRPWQIQAGTTLVYDPGVFNFTPGPNNPAPNPNLPNEETVVVQNVAGVLVANFQYPHNKGAIVISRGNPGPWTKYDPALDGQVVPYWVIID